MNSTILNGQKCDALSNFGIFILLMSILSVNPFVLNCAIPSLPNKIIYLSSVIMMIGLLSFKQKIKIINKNLFYIVFLQCTFSLIFSYIHDDFSYMNEMYHGIMFIIAYVFITNIIGIPRVSKFLIIFFIIIGILSIIAVLLNIIGMLHPISTFNNPDGRVSYNYLITFSNAVFDFGDMSLIRPASFFDEPGKFALYITYMIIINRLLGWSKVAERLLIVAGFFTMSLAFFITMVLYFGFFFININLKNFVELIIFSVLILSILIGIYTQKDNNEVAKRIYKQTLYRLELSEDKNKIINGDNRTIKIIEAATVFIDNKFIGYGREKSIEKYPELSANIMVPLAVDGIVGCIFVYLMVLYMVYLALLRVGSNSLKLKAFKCVFLICIQYVSNPSILSYLDYILISIIIYFIKVPNTAEYNIPRTDQNTFKKLKSVR